MEQQSHCCNHFNCIASPNESVCQTLSEMDWERGIWNAGDLDRINLLIGKAKNSKELVNSLDNAGYTALHYAARNGHVNICNILLGYGAYIDSQTRSGKATPLYKATVADNLPDGGEHTNLLICSGRTKCGVELHHSTRNSFLKKVMKYHERVKCKEDVVKLLIQHGAKIDLQDADGKTPLHKAVENKSNSIINTLLAACPTLNNIRDNKGRLAIV